MLNLRKLVKPYRNAGAQHALYGPHRFIDEQVFLTKGNALGVVLSVGGIDTECLTDETVETYTKRAANAWRAFDERFRIYQYVVKQDRAPIEGHAQHANPVVLATVNARRQHLESKAAGLYTLRLVYVLMLEPTLAKSQYSLSTRKLLRGMTADLERNRATLLAHACAFQRNMNDLLDLAIVDKGAAFSFFRLLANLDPDTAAAEQLKHDAHVDYFMPSLPLICADEGIRIGSADVEVLSLKEPPSPTFPNILRDLLSLQANFILCTEFRRVVNDKAITTIRAAQTHFHWSQWVSDLPSIVSMIMNRGNRENVIADKSALNDVEELDEVLKRINNGGEYLGEFSFTIIMYDWTNQVIA